MALSGGKGVLPWGEAGRLQDQSMAGANEMDVERLHDAASLGGVPGLKSFNIV